MRRLDCPVIPANLVGTVAFGAEVSGAWRDVKDDFVTGRTVSWWAIMGST